MSIENSLQSLLVSEWREKNDKKVYETLCTDEQQGMVSSFFFGDSTVGIWLTKGWGCDGQRNGAFAVLKWYTFKSYQVCCCTVWKFIWAIQVFCLCLCINCKEFFNTQQSLNQSGWSNHFFCVRILACVIT